MCPLFFVYLSKSSGMINSVRNAVLTILNKNNYGYISPADFNLLAQNAQMELYEEYFSNYNKSINAENVRASGTEYADIKKPISETLESFLVSAFLVPKYTNNYYLPSVTTTGTSFYMLNKVIVYNQQITTGTATGILPLSLVDAGATFVADGIQPGDVVVNTSTFQSAEVVLVASPTLLVLSSNIFTGLDNYAVYKVDENSEVEHVTNANITRLVNSNLTTPSSLYPAYAIIGDTMTIHPDTVQGYGSVRADFFRQPYPPKWTYSLLSSGEPVFDQSQPDYQDFELPLEDEYKLVTKILEYCGIVIRETQVTQFGMAQQQHEQPTFSMQQ